MTTIRIDRSLRIAVGLAMVWSSTATAQSGQFRDAPAEQAIATGGKSVVVGDLEPDGDLDVVTVLDGSVSICVNDGTGRFQVTTLTLPGSGFVGHPALGDIDGDHDLDLLVPRTLGAPALLRNDGTPSFTSIPFSPTASLASNEAAFADLDGDGDLDAVLIGQPFQIHRNDGSGVFVEDPSAAPRINTSSGILAVDVEPDGDIDLITTSGPLFDNLLLNDGHGTFAFAPGTAWAASGTYGICAGDFDRDGRIDLYFGANAARGVLLLQRTLRQWTDVSATNLPQLANWNFEADVAAADLDGDGDLDIFAGCHRILLPEPDRIYLNRGDGSFEIAPATRIESAAVITNAVQLADVDGDGDLDLLRATPSAPAANVLLLNHHRHVSIETDAVRGAPFRLRFDLRPGYAPTFAVAVGVLGLRGTPRAAPPFGTWWLRDAPSIGLDPVFVPPGSGTATWTTLVPTDPTLAGVELGVQAGFLDPIGPPHLSNAVFATVR